MQVNPKSMRDMMQNKALILCANCAPNMLQLCGHESFCETVGLFELGIGVCDMRGQSHAKLATTISFVYPTPFNINHRSLMCSLIFHNRFIRDTVMFGKPFGGPMTI